MNRMLSKRKKRYLGSFDSIDGEVAVGWMLDSRNKEDRLVVKLLYRGKPVAIGTAEAYRPDLEQLGIGDGNHGFRIEVPAELAGAPHDRFGIQDFDGAGPALTLSVATSPFGRLRAHITNTWRSAQHKISLLLGTQSRNPTGLAEADDEMGAIEFLGSGEIRGWAKERRDGKGPALVALVVDGIQIGTSLASLPRLDSGNKMRNAGFYFSIPDHFLDGKTRTVAVLRGEPGQHLQGSPTKFSLRGTSAEVRGHVDRITNRRVSGWAIDQTRPGARLTLKIAFGNQCTVIARADQHREDLEELLGADSNCGFSVQIPFASLNRETIIVSVEVADSGQELTGSGRTFTPKQADLDAAGASLPKSLMKVFARSQKEFHGDTGRFFELILPALTDVGSRPLVSIVMPTWNRAQSISLAIDSVIAQKYENWELNVIDDGGDDNTSDVVESYQDSRIKYIKIERNGVSGARNRGLWEAKGKFIAYLDSDNSWRTSYLEFMVAFMETKNLDTAYCASQSEKDGHTYYRACEFDWEALLQGNYIDLNVFMHRAALVESHGGFDETLKRMVDWDLILRYTKTGKVGYAPFVGVLYDDNSRDDRITTQESRAYEFVVLQKQLIDWQSLRDQDQVVNKLVSIVIPVYNHARMTERCVNSIVDNTSGHFEIVIVNNGSNISVRERLIQLENQQPLVRVIHNFKNMNFALGCNLGGAIALGETLIFLNNDTLVTKGWCAPLIDRLHESDQIGMVQPKLLYPDGTVQCCGASFSPFSTIPYHHHQGLRAEDYRVNVARELNALTGACIAIRRADFLELEGFDPIFINGCEDTDLCLRMISKLNKRCFFEPASTVYHFESKTPGRGKNILENRLKFKERWVGKIESDNARVYLDEEKLPTNYVADNPRFHEFGVATYRPSAFIPKSFLLKHELEILIVKPSGVGNMVMFTPTLPVLRELMPNARITMACFGAEAQIAGPLVDSIIKLPKDPDTGRCDVAYLERAVAKEKFDIALYPPFTNLGKPTPELERLIPFHVVHPKIDYSSKHEVQHNYDIARILGAKGEPGPMQCPTESFGQLRLPKKYIAMHPGSSSSEHMQKKRWPNQRWASLIDQLVEKNKTVVIVGGPDEQEDVESILALISERNTHGVVAMFDNSMLSLRQTGMLLKNAQAVISNDSGMMHMAAATQTPLVAIFGPTSESKNGPWGSKDLYRIVRKQVHCSPCYVASPENLLACRKQICLESITVSDVIQALAELDNPEGKRIEAEPASI